MNSKSWETPFSNDMFALVWQVFKRLYPPQSQKIIEIDWSENVFDGDEEAGGVTVFETDGSIRILISGQLSVVDAVEVFAHELAHVAAGPEAEHGEAWENAFDAIHTEYMKMIEQGGVKRDE